MNESTKDSGIGPRDTAPTLPLTADTPETVTTSGKSRGAGMVWSQAGATMVVPIGAPDPEAHRPRLSEAEIHAILDRKRRARDEAISRRMESVNRETPEGTIAGERFAAAIAHDMELCASTTNRKQLAEIGVELPAAGNTPDSPGEIQSLLWRLVYGLARLGIFLVDTEHLDDRALLTLLLDRIIDDNVPDIPPNDDMTEFIGLCDPAANTGSTESVARLGHKPDGLNGPFESADEEADDEWHPWGASDGLIGAEEAESSRVPNDRVRSNTHRTPLPGKGRDRILPRPYRERGVC